MHIDTKIQNEQSDAGRNVQHLSVLIPARRFSIEFDVTTKRPLSALLENSLKLISIIERINPAEMQYYFGLDDNEREALLDQMQKTGWIEVTEDGELVPTLELLNWKNTSETELQLEELKNFKEMFVVDLLTSHIQPRAIDTPMQGLPLISNNNIDDNTDIDPTLIFSQQFRRFQSLTNKQELQNLHIRLYRIKRCEHDRVTTLPVSLNIYSHNDSINGLQMRPIISGFTEMDQRLVMNSGVMRKITDYFNEPSIIHSKITLADYCALVNDSVLLRYDRGTFFDLDSLLKDREKRKTGYGEQETRMIIGPLYLDHNKGNLSGWLSNIGHETPLNPAIWWPSGDKLWAASLKIKIMTDDLRSSLENHKTFLTVLLPSNSPRENHELSTRFKGRIGSAVTSPETQPLDNIEILVIPGQPGWAMCQYHVHLHPSCGMAGVTIPIGYITYNPERVKILWDLLLSRCGDPNQIHTLFGRPDVEKIKTILSNNSKNTQGDRKIISLRKDRYT